MLLCYVIDSGLSTSLLLLATLIIMFYIYITLHLHYIYINALDNIYMSAANKNLAIANRSRVSCAHNMPTASMITP